MDTNYELASARYAKSWSVEALRGSLESNHTPSQPQSQSRPQSQSQSPIHESTMTTTHRPRHEFTRTRAAPRATAAASSLISPVSRAGASVEKWLDSPTAGDPSPVIDAVSELFSTRGESTFPSPSTTFSPTAVNKSRGKRRAEDPDRHGLSPPNRPTQRPRKTSNNSSQGRETLHSTSHPRESPPYVIREVGAFAKNPAPSRPGRYRPLSHWCSLWLE
ncbi:hypothetical protein B0I35DRAFT_31872 [Stachybotrys elegans]|uniref:Uncharacterized protein n=1 Tax=Stachybotrys elegans TaxID=80388 RepID=A0A8K0T2F1_9HYPO|nr:hypothetical protein B0I35DRAFT_31872 [Stachybotrys elegans]